MGICTSVRIYFFLLKTHRRKKTFLLAYKENFLHFKGENEDKYEVGRGKWSLDILGIILFTYVLCSVPCLTVELFAFYCSISDTLAMLTTLVYSLHFYVPTSVNIYMAWREFKTSRDDDVEAKGENKVQNLRENYRFRKLSRAYSYNSFNINTPRESIY